MKASGFAMVRTFTYVVLAHGLCSGCMLIGDEHGSRAGGLADEALCDGERDYVVRQGDFTTTIQALEGSESAQDFYAYSQRFGNSADTGLEQADESTIFIYRDTVNNRFSLFLIHDKPHDGDGGSSRLRIHGLDNASTVAVNDDPNAATPEGIAAVPTAETVASWDWDSCCTDGTAVTFTSGEICITIEPEVMNGIANWSVVSGTLAQPTRTPLPSLMEPFSICFEDNHPPSADPGEPQVLECTDGGAIAILDGLGSFDPDGDPLSFQWLIDETVQRDGAVVSEFLPVGAHTADLTVSDGTCQDTARTTVSVVDTLPPVISVGGSIELWPPNHKLQTVSLADCDISIQDACEGELDLATAQAAISCVSSDEPENSTGDGNTVADIVFVDNTTVKLRAERRGMYDGRVYKIHFTVQDAAGNTASSTCVASVPHDQRGTPATDNAEEWQVCRP